MGKAGLGEGCSAKDLERCCLRPVSSVKSVPQRLRCDIIDRYKNYPELLVTKINMNDLFSKIRTIISYKI